MNLRTLVLALGAITAGAVCAAPADLAINEIAWGGRAMEYTDEWIELVNTSERPVDLAGWRLVSSDGAPNILLDGVLPPRSEADPGAGYFLLERDDDDSVPPFRADWIYEGALSDAGETLFLYAPDGRLADSANAPASPEDEAGSWPGGTGGPGESRPCSMERINPFLPDEPANWTTCRCAADPECDAAPCGTPKRENSAHNLPPTASIIIDPPLPAPAEPILFDASSSVDENDRIAAFSWTFGDGTTGSGQTASHTYLDEGEYEIVLTVRDGKGAVGSTTRTLRVHARTVLLADFSLIPPIPGEPPRAGAPVSFHDETHHGPAEIIRRVWNFGDGATAEGERVSHEYASAGNYSVRLEVVDEQGSRGERTATVAIASRVPSALFVVETECPNDVDPVSFDARSSSDPDGEVVRFLWDFDGDGTIDETTEEPSIERVLGRHGTLSPTLIVEDADGDRSTPFCVMIQVNAAPVAQFAASTFAPRETEEVEFVDASFDPDGTARAWHWDFGDGETSTQTSPEHAFQTSGSHTVTLIVIDDQGASAAATATLTVANLPPTASIATGCGDAETGVAFAFDASGSVDPSPNGSIVSYAWDVDGDGSFDRETTAPSLSHAYDQDGTYDVTVRVTDDSGETAVSEPIRVTVRNRPPVVRRIRLTPGRPTDADEVVFQAEASDPDGDVVAWVWTFGGEGTSTSPEPQHAFAHDTTYEIRLVVRDDDGAASEPFSVAIDVANALPIALFTFAEVGPRTIAFSAASARDPSQNGRIVHVAWDFGDGTACPENPSSCGGDRTAPIHRFAEAGTYAVTLIVIDEDGGVGRLTRILTIP